MVSLKTLIDKSDKRIKTLHHHLQAAVYELIARAYTEGIYITISQANRTMAEQQALYDQGRTKPGNIVTNAKPGQSYHNYGVAFDFAVYSDHTLRSINWTVDSKWMRVGAIGKALGFEWGGDWTSFKDYPHFQAPGLSLADLRAGKRPTKPLFVQKEEKYKMKAEDANAIIETYLGPAWNFSKSDIDKKELNRLANELRKASNQPTQ